MQSHVLSDCQSLPALGELQGSWGKGRNFFVVIVILGLSCIGTKGQTINSLCFFKVKFILFVKYTPMVYC